MYRKWSSTSESCCRSIETSDLFFRRIFQHRRLFSGHSDRYSHLQHSSVHFSEKRDEKKEDLLPLETLKWSPLGKPTPDDAQYPCTPYSRYGHTVIVYKEKFFLWGGRNDHSGACNRLFSFDPGQNLLLSSLTHSLTG